MRIQWILYITLSIAIPFHSDVEARSKAQVNHFKKSHPCPASGQTSGPCPGYIIDHVIPLCAGGADRPRNMQWQTAAEAKAKDRLERQQCMRAKGR